MHVNAFYGIFNLNVIVFASIELSHIIVHTVYILLNMIHAVILGILLIWSTVL